MSLVAPSNDPGQLAMTFNNLGGWAEVRKGLLLIGLGYAVLITGTLVGSLLVSSVLGGSSATHTLIRHSADADALMLLGVGALGGSLFSSAVLILIGQWRCLMHSPERGHAKEIMLVCMTCVLVGTSVHLFAPLAGGATDAQSWVQGMAGAQRLGVLKGGNILKLAGAGLLLLSCILFSQFLGTAASCFGDRRKARSADFFTWFVGLLLGGSIGGFICLYEVSFRFSLLQWLMVGWSLCYAWHLWLILGIRRCISWGLVQSSGVPTDEWIASRASRGSSSGLFPRVG